MSLSQSRRGLGVPLMEAFIAARGIRGRAGHGRNLQDKWNPEHQSREAGWQRHVAPCAQHHSGSETHQQAQGCRACPGHAPGQGEKAEHQAPSRPSQQPWRWERVQPEPRRGHCRPLQALPAASKLHHRVYRRALPLSIAASLPHGPYSWFAPRLVP